MALMRWEPLSELEQMRRGMERMMDRLLPRVTWAPGLSEEGTEVFVPDVDVYRTGDDLVISANLPGLRPEDVSVEMAPDAVTISGESKRESEYQDASIYRAERQYGCFCRAIALPDKVKDQEAKATFKDGILTVRAPVAEEAKREGRKIAVESA